MRPNRFLLASLLLVPLAASCMHIQDEHLRTAEALDMRHHEEMRAFEAEKQRVSRIARDETIVDFGPDGRIYVQEVELIGWPSAAYLRMRYTYLNTSEVSRRAPRVTLAVVDPATGEDSWVTDEGVLPLGLRLQPESTYSGYVEVPTNGLHRRSGWRWEIGVE